MTYRPRHGHAGSGGRGVVLAGLAVLLVALLGVGGVFVLHSVSTAEPRRHAGHRDLARPTTGAAAQSTQPPASLAPAPRLVPFAEAEGVVLHLPSARVACVCYHEASFSWTRELTPIGRVAHNYNRTKFSVGDAKHARAPRYIVMSSRGRKTGATTAADIALPKGTPVEAPVSGTVTKIKPYRLYGQYRDEQVEIRPDGHPDLRVVLIHLDEVRVHEGQQVVATRTVLGIPRVFPFGSQTSDYIKGGFPHVHIEIATAHPGQSPAKD